MGNTGIAHVFEHIAFKGTTTLGTLDYEKEKAIMNEMDRIYDEMKTEWAKGRFADQEKLSQLEAEFGKLQDEESQYSQGEEYSTILEQEGADDLNASITGKDGTTAQKIRNIRKALNDFNSTFDKRIAIISGLEVS